MSLLSRRNTVERKVPGLGIFGDLALVVLVAGFLQGATGIGFAPLVTPVIGIVDPRLLPVAVLSLMLPLNAVAAWREREYIDLRGAGWILVARVLATPLGNWILAVVSEAHLGILIGGITVVAAVVSLLAPSFNPNRALLRVASWCFLLLLGAGAVTGVSETVSGIGGPPYALVYQHRPAPELHAAVALCFLVGEVVSLAGLSISGKFLGPGLDASLWLLPIVIVGVWLSSLVHRQVGGRFLRLAILMFAMASGVIMLFRSL